MVYIVNESNFLYHLTTQLLKCYNTTASMSQIDSFENKVEEEDDFDYENLSTRYHGASIYGFLAGTRKCGKPRNEITHG